jgi:class 3 adenylate cyclase
MTLPETRYARSGEASIAYQVFGEGEIDLLALSGWISNFEHSWEASPQRRFYERLAEFSRVIICDPRGSGLSDDLGVNYTLEQDAEDVMTVLDAVGSDRVAVYARWLGGALGVRLAAEHPERIAALVLYSSPARTSWAPDYDWALKPEQREKLIETSIQGWGETQNRELARWAPSAADDPALASWLARQQRLLAAPGRARIRWQETAKVDVRELLPRVRAPTLIMHRRGDQVWDPRHSEYMAEHIPDARYVPMEGTDAIDFVGDSDAILDEIEEFLTGVRRGGEGARALLTVMFTDIVDSTRRASELGDHRWGDLLASHDEVVRREIARYGGTEVKTMGDGFLVTFDGPPSAALRCGQAIEQAAKELGVELRVGLHTGECELTGGGVGGRAVDVGGMAVHVASRIATLAEPGEIAVSPAVANAVVGGPFEFENRGEHELKGVPGRWPVFALRPEADRAA